MLKLEHTTNNSWLCDACDRAPAAFFCKADAASLCCACDLDIHSANPLSRRHHRVPIVPGGGGGLGTTPPYGEDEEAASWLLLKNDPTSSFCGDEFLDLVDSYTNTNNPCQQQDNNNNNNNNNNQFNENPFNMIINDRQQQQQQHYYNKLSCNRIIRRGGDSVVPIIQQQQQQQQQQQVGSSDYDQSSCTNVPYNYSASISHSTVSLSHLDIGVVPESTTTMSENSISHTQIPKGTIDHFSGPLIQIPTQLSPMDREARVLRYREKKKARKFEKTIRYASRKAYAETRPRIKGRFAKRTDVAEVEVDQLFSTSVIAESGYGIVPSF